MQNRRYLFPGLILLLGLLVSLASAWQLARAEQRRAEARFEAGVVSAGTAIINKLNTDLALLRGARGLFSASGEVNEPAFRAYVASLGLDQNYPGILGIGFAEAGIVGRPVPGHGAVDVGMTSAIRLLEPLGRNRTAIGIDMLSEPSRREAMLRSWNTDAPALSPMVRLVQEPEPLRSPGFLLYLPLRFDDGVFRGWVYSPLRGFDLFGSLFQDPEYRDLHIRVFDGTEGQPGLLFTSGPEPGEPLFRHSLAVPFGGRTLKVDIASTDAFESAASPGLPILVGLLGLFVTLLLAALAWQQQRTVERIQRRVLEATSELRGANARLRDEAAARVEAEAQLFQAQKMEAVGQLTGGIAHDFNNMLAVVIGSLDFARHVEDPARVRKLVAQALKGATKAAELTQRLLAFSRRQTLMPTLIDPNAMVADMSELLRRSIGGHTRLRTVLTGEPWPIQADSAQLESAILNLAVNARDAMPEGGELTIETANCHLDEAYAQRAEIAAGDYVLIAVSDTGEGMSPDVKSRVLEPFFTTKPVGKGTGLGLSQVFGFVKQSGGHLAIYSEVGRGTTIKIYLPRHRGEGRTGDSSADRPIELPRGRADEIILAVEDEEDVRLMSVGALRDLGYTVIHAGNGREALDALEGHPGVRLVFTDVVMPQMDGAELAAEIRRRYPDLRLLFTTGYARGAISEDGRLPPDTELISKPFTISELACRVRSVLDAPVRGPVATE